MPLTTIKPQLAVAWTKSLDKLEYPVIAEPKLDGVRCVAHVTDEPEFWSRDQKPFVNFEELEEDIKKMHALIPQLYYSGQLLSHHNIRLDGEIMAVSGNFDETISRSRSHRGKNTHIDYVYNVFDIIIEGQTFTLSQRKALLEHWFGLKFGKRIRIVPYRTIPNAAELWDYHEGNCDAGYEGTMVKPTGSYYHNGRNKDWKKIKPFHTADLHIVSMSEGAGKASGMMGRILVKGRVEDLVNLSNNCDPCSDAAWNYVRCEVGTGFTDELRKAMWNDPDKYIGMIAEIQYQEVTKDGSLRFPSFKRFRLDKEEETQNAV